MIFQPAHPSDRPTKELFDAFFSLRLSLRAVQGSTLSGVSRCGGWGHTDHSLKFSRAPEWPFVSIGVDLLGQNQVQTKHSYFYTSSKRPMNHRNEYYKVLHMDPRSGVSCVSKSGPRRRSPPVVLGHLKTTGILGPVRVRSACRSAGRAVSRSLANRMLRV